jgi:SAM-dependent methyltransferase
MSQRSAGTYVFEQDRQDEARRLAGMEDLWDPGTRAVLGSLGLAPGWRCLEVGAGSGSIASWLAERVGPHGEVVATDVSTRHLEWLEAPNLEVWEHDILGDPLPAAQYDLVHARLVVEHLGRAAIERMVAALRPGGWLVVEDLDGPPSLTFPHDARWHRLQDIAVGFMAAAGYEPYCGRTLVHELERIGLTDVAADGRLRIHHGGSPDTTFMRLSIESLAVPLIDSGEATREQVEDALLSLEDPDLVFACGPMIAAWGRRA